LRGHLQLLSVCFVLPCLILCGCARREGSVTIPYPSSLSDSSTPSEVAALLIKALDEENEEVLTALVAAKSEAEAIGSIFSKYGRRSSITPEKAARVAAAGWQATYAFFEKGATAVAEEQISGETAVVRANGRNASTGEAQSLTITLIREDGLWKIRAGLLTSSP